MSKMSQIYQEIYELIEFGVDLKEIAITKNFPIYVIEQIAHDIEQQERWTDDYQMA